MTHTTVAVTPVRIAPSPASRIWPLIAVTGLAVFVAAVVTAGLRNPGYDPLSEGISGLGAQNAIDPAVMKVAFLALALTTVAAGVALFRVLPGKSGRAASIIVVLGGLGLIAVAFVRQDCSTARTRCVDAEFLNTVSNAHVYHQLIALGVAMSLGVSLWLMAASLRGNSDTEPLARPTRWVAIASICVFIWLGSQFYADIGGVVEKLLIALIYGWPVFLAVALNRKRFAMLPRRSLATGRYP